ncbi:MAG: hypothetical protein AAB465_01535 [Patescibacteria group bacterium]
MMKFFEQIFKKAAPAKEVVGEKSEEGSEESKKETTPYVPDETERLLGTREKESTTKLIGGANESIVVKLKDDGRGIFKPLKGEEFSIRRDVGGDLFKRERAAYLVDKFLDLGLVPSTVIREIDGEIGSIQEFIPDTKFIGEFTEDERKQYKTELIKLFLFDAVIWNQDRHGHNFLLKDGKIYAIDNGYAFDSSSPLFYGDYASEPIPEEIKEKFRKFLSWTNGLEILKTLLDELLTPRQAKACIARIKFLGDIMKKQGVLPSEKDVKFNPSK